uniref:Uncharacterized protein MANES_15G156800 n=1 Tax=Rhizophora mucronata TaxID=61149 RepID=A0A2P2J9M4_RHIMU
MTLHFFISRNSLSTYPTHATSVTMRNPSIRGKHKLEKQCILLILFYQFLALMELFSFMRARLSSLTNLLRSSKGRLSISFLRSSLNAGHLSSRCHSQLGYSESGKTFGSAPSLRMLAPTTVVDLTSLLSVSFGASDAALPPLAPFFALPAPAENILFSVALTTPLLPTTPVNNLM